jgi:oligoribonuclease NrnB/cAMP/cGMP phosphodiesterase (DHH superfamily)
MSLKEVVQKAIEYLAPSDVEVVIYHHPCTDGAGSALCAWLKYRDKIEFIPLQYQDHLTPELEARLHNKNVIMIDISFRKEQFVRMQSITKKIAILDHHDSALKELGDVPGCFFAQNNENSGAVLAWHYFHGIDTQTPTLLRLIEDRDLWRWSERDLSEPLSYALYAFYPNRDFKMYEQYLQSDLLEQLIVCGKSLMAANHDWCVAASAKAEFKTLTTPISNMKYEIICAQFDNSRLFDELAEYLYTNNTTDLVMLWYQRSDGKFKISFRGNNLNINLGEIAREFGGGGHVSAAAVVIDSTPRDYLQERVTSYPRLLGI